MQVCCAGQVFLGIRDKRWYSTKREQKQMNIGDVATLVDAFESVVAFAFALFLCFALLLCRCSSVIGVRVLWWLAKRFKE